MTTQHSTKTEMKEKRMQDLLDSCQGQVLQQIIGPFGLTGAMFDDKGGGNVTTLKNFENGVTATQEDKVSNSEWRMSNNGGYTRKKYDAVKSTIRNDIKSKEEYLTSQYTGDPLHIDDVELDHVVAVKTIETASRGHLFMNLDERVEMASQKDNLVASEAPINQSKGAKDPIEWAKAQRKADKGKTNAESFGVDEGLLKKTDSKAKAAIEADLLKAQIQKQGSELLSTGAKEAGKMAMRQAFGVLIYEFVNGVFIETKQLFHRLKDENLIDELIAAIKRVAKRVIAKFKDAGKAALGGGIQGFFSNLLTFLINNIVKTSAKVVTIIRESMKSIWQAFKFIAKPPKHLSPLEVTRQVTKILTVAVATGLGMFFEEAIQTFIMTIPILAPIAGIVAPAIAAILTGIATALLVYGLDRFFDWLSDNGTQLLEAVENNLDVMQGNIDKMALWIEEQYNQSNNYAQIGAGYDYIQREFALAINAKNSALATSKEQNQKQIAFNKNLTDKTKEVSSQEQSVSNLLSEYKLGEQ
jgi:phage antirepressor YoqD-like protein